MDHGHSLTSYQSLCILTTQDKRDLV